MSANTYMTPVKRLYSLAQGLGLPVDFAESTTAAHPRPVFTVRASVGPFSAEGRGPNRREAKNRACVMVTNLVETYQRNHSYAYGYTYTNDYAHLPPHCHPDFRLGKDPCTRLSELLMALKHPPAQYRLLEGTVIGAHWTFSMEVSVDQWTAVGTGGSKKEARRRATAALLQMMGYAVLEEELLPPAPQTTTNPAPQNAAEPARQNAAEPAPQNAEEPAPEPENALEKQTRAPSAPITPDFRLQKDPTTRLSELQMIRRGKIPQYRQVGGELVNGSWVFTVEVTLDQFTASGSGRTKREAKRNASTSLLLLMGFKVPEKDLPLENPEESTSEEHSEVQSPRTAPVRAEGSETQMSGERRETLSNPEPLSSNCSEGHQTLGEFHKGPVLNPEDLETQTETQDQESETLETPEDLESPMEVKILEVLKETKSLDNSKSPEADQNPEESETQETPDNVGSPEEEELLCTIDNSSSDDKSPDSPVAKLEDLETQTETQDQEQSETGETPEDVKSPMEDQILEIPPGLKQQSPEDEELLSLFDESPENDQTPEQLDISSEGDLSPTEPQAQEPQTLEDTLTLMEVQNHLQLQTAEEPNREEVQLHTAEDVPAEVCEKLETESPASAPEPPAAPQASQTLGSVESLVIQTLVKKLLQKLPSKMKSHHDAVVQTLEKALDQFKVPALVHINIRNIKKLGKAGARDLIHEYGSASKLLTMALGPDPTEFQKDAMKHLNFRLSAFMNRPRTILGRLFPQWDKPKRAY
ncbi:hypothetical protein NL108_011537 [Boleophthalmus pectinirostris]|nr:hypothetical protein NL108_011537 [Boleophthalmus pectinirostris]